MTIQEFLREYDNLNELRQEDGMNRFLARLASDTTNYWDFIYEAMELAVNYEMDDYFGTEGMDI